jgi:hypothetical protein
VYRQSPVLSGSLVFFTWDCRPGGVWKTTSAGETWFPVFDSIQEVSSVGAIQVAPSDPNIIHVGMGDMITGGAINEGNGVYKSTDAGRTWQHLGLDGTKQIPTILVVSFTSSTIGNSERSGGTPRLY